MAVRRKSALAGAPKLGGAPTGRITRNPTPTVKGPKLAGHPGKTRRGGTTQGVPKPYYIGGRIGAEKGLKLGELSDFKLKKIMSGLVGTANAASKQFVTSYGSQISKLATQHIAKQKTITKRKSP